MAIKEIVKGICGKSRCKYDVYTKEKTDELLNGFILYDNPTGEEIEQGGSVPLSDSVTNYKSLEICYGNLTKQYCKTDAEIGVTVLLNEMFIEEKSSATYIYYRHLSVSENKLDVVLSKRVDLRITPAIDVYNSNQLKIRRVIGYK